MRELHRDGRRHVAHHRQDRPLSGLAHRRVGALRAARHRRADEHRVDELSGARDELLGGAADQLREDHAAVAASAEQRGARDGVDDLRPPDVVERAIVADLGETLDLGQAGVEREHHVVARIAVGDGKDVEIVDLLPARLEVRERALKAGAEADEAGRRVRRGHARSRVMPSRRPSIRSSPPSGAPKPRWMRRVLRRLSLLGRFSLLSLAALALTGVAVGVALHQRIEHRAIDSAKSLAIATASTGAQASLSEADLTAPLSVARLHELDRTLSSPLAGAGVIRTKVYDADGEVRYSDDRSMIVEAHGAEHEEAGSDEIAEVIESGKAETELAKGTSENGQGERDRLVLRSGARRAQRRAERGLRGLLPVRADRRGHRARHADARRAARAGPAGALDQHLPTRRRSFAEAHAAGQGGRPDRSSEPRGAARRRRTGAAQLTARRGRSTRCC